MAGRLSSRRVSVKSARPRRPAPRRLRRARARLRRRRCVDASGLAPARRGVSVQTEGPVLRLYDYLESGNGYKVRLLLHQLGIAFERVEVDILAGETRTPEFLRLNPNGRIPLLELPDGSRLAESNAILAYLAEGTPYLPDDRLARAQVLQWMFFEQYSHEPFIAVLRFWTFAGRLEANRAAVPEKRERGTAALRVMEQHLSEHPFFVGGAYTIADVALYAYTHVADEGGFDLSPFPALCAWLERVRGQPGNVPITWSGA
ncbi:MAG: glutathione S-transferase family protein [Deltaproteobacteria bacterium]|nr:MAG: glutathione S-transferase family protein [Deltaproteobacteria bacterium]